MKMIVRRMGRVVARMENLKDPRHHIRVLVESPSEGAEIFDRLCSVDDDDEILPVTVWPDSVVRH